MISTQIAGDPGVPFPGIPAAQSVSKTDGVLVYQNGTDRGATVAAIGAANEESIADLPAGPSPATLSDIVVPVFSISANRAVMYPLSTLLNLGSGSGAPVAPSQVGNFAPGTPTSSTIPVTYTAPTGTAPFTYSAQTSTDGGTTWVVNGATFNATGGTYSGLAGNTAYELRLVVSNAGGSSTTTYSGTVTTAAAGGGAVAPSQVGNFVPGTPTSSTIPVTYTAPTGSAPFTYSAQTSTDGGTNWVVNGATFNATGGTYSGLAGNTAYKLRLVVSNAGGSSTTTYSGTITTAAAVAGGGAMTLTNPTFATGTNAIFGSGASLSGGSGVATLTLAVNPGIQGGPTDQAIGSFVVLVKIPNAQFYASSPFIWLQSTDVPSGNTTRIGWQLAWDNTASFYQDSEHHTSKMLGDGALHQLQINFKADYGYDYTGAVADGVQIEGQSGAGNTYLHSGAGNASLHYDFSQLPPGSLMDVMWFSNDQTLRPTLTSEPTHDATTNVLFLFDAQDGAVT